MSGASGSGAPPPAGVVQNSALSFVASAQVMQTSENELAAALPAGNLQETSGEQSAQADRLVPPGLKALCAACCKLYPDQPNPLQVTTRLKYWLGGEDPLDYISMYWSPGRPEEHIPPHWHYISFGLSDLHGDGRVHPSGGAESGYGFELTFRLESSERQPPLWPAQLCQALARYVFTTGNKLCAGDHISWHRSLEGSARGRLRHLLVAPDAAFRPVHTTHGRVEFLQIVGCTGRELKAAQRGSGFEVLKLIGNDPNCGGPWLVTRIRRRRSAADVRINRTTPAHSPLAGVSAKVSWAPLQGVNVESPASSPADIPVGIEQQIKDTLQRGLSAMSSDSVKLDDAGKMSTGSFEMSSLERALPQIPETLDSSWGGEDSVQYFEGVHIVMNPEGASLLPLALDGRVRRGAHFTWRCGAVAVTLAAPRVRGALATEREPYAARDYWLQRGRRGDARGAPRARSASLGAGALRGLGLLAPGEIERHAGLRVPVGAHFTWRCGAVAVTLAAPRVRGALATEREPYAARDYWLQVVIPETQAIELSRQVAPLAALGACDSETDSESEEVPLPPTLPLTIKSRGLLITVLPDSHFL